MITKTIKLNGESSITITKTGEKITLEIISKQWSGIVETDSPKAVMQIISALSNTDEQVSRV